MYKVAELTRLVKAALEESFGEVWVEGELSNVRQPASGHLYVTLKDETTQLKAVMFKGDQRGLAFRPADGLMVRVFGRITVYEPAGAYQIVVRRMEEAGKGSLQEAFEALKKKLAAEGLFDAARKKTLPALPQHVGIVTSPTGAAIRDILKIASRRFPNLHILIAPVRVQGAGAAEEIASAIDLLNERGRLDVMIVGRGGGSIEDLWCFNEEVVARAIARSRIPVISAVGHETDFTISDFVADFRAPTPSAAAEQLVECKEALEQQVRDMRRRAALSLQAYVMALRNRLLAASGSPVFAEPRGAVAGHLQRMHELRMRVEHALRSALRSCAQRLDEADLRSRHSVLGAAQGGAQAVRRLAAQLAALDPHAVLRRGYSITTDERKQVVRSASALRRGQKIRTKLMEGEFESEVLATSTGGTRNEREESRRQEGR